MRPLRIKDGKQYQLITLRTVRAELWLTPSSNVSKLIGGILARYQEIFGIKIYAYCFLGNHYHLIVRAPRENLDEFLENVNREIARRINWKHHREGKLWARRYDALSILSDEDLIEAFLYVTTNPGRHGLVQDSREWPGLNSYEQCLTERERAFSFYHYSAQDGEQRITKHKLRLSVLPPFEELSKKERREKLSSLLRKRTERITQERCENGQGFLGLSGIREQEPGARPQNISRSKKPPCYTKYATLRREFRKMMKLLRQRYNEASVQFRLGDMNVTFPEHTFKPPLHRLPRLFPFSPMLPADS